MYCSRERGSFFQPGDGGQQLAAPKAGSHATGMLARVPGARHGTLGQGFAPSRLLIHGESGTNTLAGADEPTATLERHALSIPACLHGGGITSDPYTPNVVSPLPR